MATIHHQLPTAELNGLSAQNRTKKILYLYSKTGGGHLASAKAIIEALDEIEPGIFEHTMVDFIESTSQFMNLFAKSYGPLIKYAPWAYGYAYDLLNRDIPLAVWEKFGHTFMNEKLERAVLDAKPAAIISVHPEANYLLSRVLRTQNLKIPFIVVVTDLINYHKSWLGCTPYNTIEDTLSEAIVPTKQAYDLAIQYNCPEHKLRHISLPLRKQFNGISQDSQNKNGFVVTIMGGGDGAGKIEKIAKELLDAGYDGTIRIIAGNNSKLKGKLEMLKSKHPNGGWMDVYGFHSDIRSLLETTDILVTKAGPGSIAEALVCKTPMIINYWVPGQETANTEFVSKNGYGYCIINPKQIAKKIMYLKNKRKELNRLKRNIQRENFKNGSLEIARRIIFHIKENAPRSFKEEPLKAQSA
jgi:1,2-diacylglycerol 3-beta-galactosyltransferase